MSQQTEPDPIDPASGASDGPAAGTVVLGIPADRDQVTLVRSVAGHIGARLGLSVAQLTDLRLAVDEACGLFLLAPGFPKAEGVLECRFEQLPEALRITVSALVPDDLAPDLDDIGWIMLDALVDQLSWTSADGVATVSLLTRLGRRA
ncbi:MAG TPA: ATP-binding protein [Actinocrinis sp.]|nr:ATP-binding protein [Actinocrinis sp.]